MNSAVFVLPTYCEVQTLPDVVFRLRDTLPWAEILVVDDASPDGTGEWAETFHAANPWLHVIHRPRKLGLASAYVNGFKWALARGYDLVGQMDSDGSHRPEQLPRLVWRMNQLDRPDGVIGSRWTRGGTVPGWNLARVALSQVGNWYARHVLGTHLKDATSGFRVYRAAALRQSGALDRVESSGYAFQAEMTHMLTTRGFRLVEVPIAFNARQAGRSKMSVGIALEQLCQVSKWGCRRLAAGRLQPRR